MADRGPSALKLPQVCKPSVVQATQPGLPEQLPAPPTQQEQDPVHQDSVQQVPEPVQQM